MTRPPQRRPAWVAGGAAVLLGGAACLATGCGRVDRTQASARLSADCGQTMAGLTRTALGDGQRILVLENDGTGLVPERQAWLQDQLAAFYSALPAGLEIEKVLVGPGSAAAAAPAAGVGLSLEGLRHYGFSPLAAHAPDADVIVSFVGTPIVGSRGVGQWTYLPPVVCFSMDGADVAALMEAGVVVGAVAPRRAAVPTKSARRGSWFEQMYEVVTPENLSEWTAAE